MKAPKIALFGAFTFMMLPAYITRDADFMDLREKIGPVAMHAIVSLGTTIQLRRENSIKLANASALVRVCDLVGDIDTELLWDALIGSWLIPLGNDCYSMPIWEEWNKQLRSAWANGEKKKESNKTESKGIEQNRTKEKGIELDARGYATSDARSDATSVASQSAEVSSNQANSIQLNSVAPRKGVGNALGNAPSEATRTAKISQINW